MNSLSQSLNIGTLVVRLLVKYQLSGGDDLPSPGSGAQAHEPRALFSWVSDETHVEVGYNSRKTAQYCMRLHYSPNCNVTTATTKCVNILWRHQANQKLNDKQSPTFTQEVLGAHVAAVGPRAAALVVRALVEYQVALQRERLAALAATERPVAAAVGPGDSKRYNVSKDQNDQSLDDES